MEDTKPLGTILDGRYELKAPVGAGGFSIVYDAINLHNGQRVAVKECTDKENKDRFMREARLLRDFSDEPAIVSVIDYFEENGTAYIIMEFLEGTTLRDEIKNSGTWDAEKTVRLFDPVMKTLERIHSAGVIHRDISPDNLMLLSDGTLKLLDFGAARENVDKTVSRMVVKASYSPPEQMDEKGVLGSWTDVYSICATMYYCITGTNPEDALSRMFLDELKAPASIGGNIVAAAEKTLMKGLSTESRARVQDMHQLRTELEKVYPIISEEEKLELAKKKRKRMIALSVAAVLAAAVIAIFVNMYRLQILLQLIDSKTIVLFKGSMTEEEYKESAKTVKRRANAFSGGRYTWKEEDDRIILTLPEELFGDKDPLTVTRLTMSRPMEMYLAVYNDELEDYQPVEKLSQREDIAKAELGEDGNKIVFSEKAQKRLAKLLKDPGLKLAFYFDIQFDNTGYRTGISDGDGKTVTLDPNEEGSIEISEELLELIFTEDPSPEAFSIECDWDVKWEDPGSNVLSGKNQVAFDALKNKEGENIICCKYSDDYNKEKEGLDIDYMSAQMIVKNRLDSLKVPYAVGIDEHDDKTIVIGLQEKNLYREAAYWICENAFSGDFRIGRKTANTEIPTEAEVQEITADGIRLSLKDYYDESSDMEMLLKTLKQQKQKEIYLYFMGTAIAKTDRKEALASWKKNNSMVFDEWCAEGDGKETAETFADYLNISLQQSPQRSYRLESVQMLDGKGRLIPAGDVESPTAFEETKRGMVNAADLKKEAGKGLVLTIDRDIIRYDGVQLNIGRYYDTKNEEGLKRAIEETFEYYRQHLGMLEDGSFKIIQMYFFERGEVEKGDDGAYRGTMSSASICIYSDFEKGSYIIDYINTDGNEDLDKEIADHIGSDPELKHLIHDEIKFY